MNNKILLSLSLFFIFPAATQCMKKEKAIIFAPNTMQEIRDERNFIYNNFYHSEDPINNILIHQNWFPFLNFLKNRKIAEAQPNYDYDSLEDDPDLSWYQKYTFKGYSLVGIATIALHTFNLDIPSKQHVSFSDKKEFISALRTHGFKETEKDKYLALDTKHEEFGPVIIKKIFLLPDILPSLEAEARQEFIKNISFLMFNLEESLL